MDQWTTRVEPAPTTGGRYDSRVRRYACVLPIGKDRDSRGFRSIGFRVVSSERKAGCGVSFASILTDSFPTEAACSLSTNALVVMPATAIPRTPTLRNSEGAYHRPHARNPVWRRSPYPLLRERSSRRSPMRR